MSRSIRHLAFVLCAAASLNAQIVEVRGRVETERTPRSRISSIPKTVVWLTPVPGTINGPVPAIKPQSIYRLMQRNKAFEPRVLVIPAGSVVEFPNRDPFFHNVFSLFEGKRFDLGLYEAGTSRTVHFDRAGVSYIFCNIHPEMSAVIITVSTPYYAIAGDDGQFTLSNVSYGRYIMRVWSEGMGPENSEPAGREITIGEGSTTLGIIHVPPVNKANLAHKNKYGREYDAPVPDNPIYQQQP